MKCTQNVGQKSNIWRCIFNIFVQIIWTSYLSIVKTYLGELSSICLNAPNFLLSTILSTIVNKIINYDFFV